MPEELPIVEVPVIPSGKRAATPRPVLIRGRVRNDVGILLRRVNLPGEFGDFEGASRKCSSEARGAVQSTIGKEMLCMLEDLSRVRPVLRSAGRLTRTH